jgi:hypothetical protein
MLPLLLLAFQLAAAESTTYTASGNFPRDLMGTADTRANTWGTADSAVLPIVFRPPAGYRVLILRLRGDLVSWPRVLPGEPPVAPGQYAGVLAGFQSTAADGSCRCDWCADNTMLYVQDAVAERPSRAPFDYAQVNFLLGPDHTLLLKIASWLNTTGRPIHIEATYTVVYRFERERQ